MSLSIFGIESYTPSIVAMINVLRIAFKKTIGGKRNSGGDGKNGETIEGKDGKKPHVLVLEY